jgi:hypothetical protein
VRWSIVTGRVLTLMLICRAGKLTSHLSPNALVRNGGARGDEALSRSKSMSVIARFC